MVSLATASQRIRKRKPVREPPWLGAHASGAAMTPSLGRLRAGNQGGQDARLAGMPKAGLHITPKTLVGDPAVIRAEKLTALGIDPSGLWRSGATQRSSLD